tara:strand:+ start:215 stop:637 length:423 start_codon:yes stop_codon:yes gene_type:complete
MAITKISGNQISTATQAIIDTLSFLDNESILRLPTGTTNNRPTGISVGTLRFATDIDAAEIYVGDADGQGNPGWTPVGSGGPSVGNDGLIRTNDNTLRESATVGPTAGTEFTQGYCMGPITVASPNVLTIENNGKLVILD